MENTGKLPRVLIWGHSFNDYSGMGITLTNLFSNWPKERIGVSAPNIDMELCEQIRPCKYYGCWSGFSRGNSVSNAKKSFVKNILKSVENKLKIRELLYRPRISVRILDGVKEFAPDIIFCSLGSLSSMKTLKLLHAQLPETPIFLYIVDDWPNTRFLDRWFVPFWRMMYEKYFISLLDVSKGYFSICKYMSDAYQKQYGKDFVPVHNPVNVRLWDSLTPQPKYGLEDSILYVGKINRETKSNLIDLCNVVEKMNHNGKKVIFDIYSPDYDDNVGCFINYQHCNLFPPVKHSDIPSLTKSYKYLFLTLGFSKVSIRYAMLSMPTKLSEYLASGCPILLYCPPDIALAKYVGDTDTAVMCFEKKQTLLYDKLELLLEDKEVAERVKRNAVATARMHESGKVRADFESAIMKFCRK